jgi:hypothetical protein
VEAGCHVIVRKRIRRSARRFIDPKLFARATRKQILVNTVRYTRLAAPRPNMLPIPTTFPPPRPEVNPRIQRGVAGGVDSSSLSVAGRSHFVGIGDTTQEQRAQTLPCKFGDPTTAITHLDTSLRSLLRLSYPSHHLLATAGQTGELSVRPGSPTIQPDIGSSERDDEAVPPATMIVRRRLFLYFNSVPWQRPCTDPHISTRFTHSRNPPPPDVPSTARPCCKR